MCNVEKMVSVSVCSCRQIGFDFWIYSRSPTKGFRADSSSDYRDALSAAPCSDENGVSRMLL